MKQSVSKLHGYIPTLQNQQEWLKDNDYNKILLFNCHINNFTLQLEKARMTENIKSDNIKINALYYRPCDPTMTS